MILVLIKIAQFSHKSERKTYFYIVLLNGKIVVLILRGNPKKKWGKSKSFINIWHVSRRFMYTIYIRINIIYINERVRMNEILRVKSTWIWSCNVYEFVILSLFFFFWGESSLISILERPDYICLLKYILNMLRRIISFLHFIKKCTFAKRDFFHVYLKIIEVQYICNK